jgi:curlin associated repeat protein
MSQRRIILPIVAVLAFTSAIAAGAGERRDSDHPAGVSDIEQIGAVAATTSTDETAIAPSAMSAGLLPNGNTVRITQQGTSNQAEVRQHGTGLEATVQQSGNGGTAGIEQSGSGLAARIDQFGNGGGAQINQFGVGNGSPITMRQF